MIALEQDPWASGVLDRTIHARLVAQKDVYAADAGIPAPYIWTPAADVLPTEDEQTWLKPFKFHRSQGYCGLAYLGDLFDPTIEVRMCGIAGGLLRNFIRARVMSMETVLRAVRGGELPDATCLLLPTFAAGKPDDRRTSLVSDLLIERWHAKKGQTVIHAASLEGISNTYDAFVASHVQAHYRQIKGAKQ